MTRWKLSTARRWTGSSERQRGTVDSALNEKHGMKLSRNRRGVSLLETMIAILILATTAWSINVLYVGLLRGTKQSDARRQALASVDTVFQIWRARALELWTEKEDASEEAYQVSDDYGEYFYRVEVSGRLDNPAYDGTRPGSKEYLDMRLIKVSLVYEEENLNKEVTIRGSVSR